MARWNRTPSKAWRLSVTDWTVERMSDSKNYGVFYADGYQGEHRYVDGAKRIALALACQMATEIRQ